DAIRSSNVCEGEAGAITQHIGAYKVNTPKGEIVFLDTPGHEAFTAMRARGAQATDIVVLVVSAVDSVMQQTIEAIDHAKAAGAPIIVAVNKIDLPEANPDKVKQDLANHGLIPEEWQGKTIYVEISAKKRLHIDRLLEMIALQAEIMDLKANPDRHGVGIILEARRDSKRGVVATVLNQKGVMRVGDPFVVGSAYGKIRAMTDEHGVRHDMIPPSTPVEILGINGEPPAVGDIMYVVESEKDARQVADKRRLIQREENLAHRKHVSLLSLRDQMENQSLKTLNIIIKGDVQGSIQAIRDSLERLSTDEVEVSIIHSGAGNVNESDILLAKASNAVIFTFHVDTDAAALAEADRSGIEVRNYQIIFELLEDVRAAMEGMLEPEVVEEVVGTAEVRQKFDLSSGIIAGSIIKSGTITRGNEVHVYRGKDNILNAKISGLKRFKEDVREVKLGFECGILIDGYTAIEPGDVITAFVKKTITRRLKTNDR
ncbi:MAG: translation initiation factor IF-2, partial [Elusimicrobiaceae bacterium]|nr:translation initiation factor IF-2 [Elusimicrobiaceae bacterium]